MRKIVVMMLVLCVGFTYAQKERTSKVEKKGDLTEVTYFDANGNIEQLGTFNSEGKLHGKWISYNADGTKASVGNYSNGRKSGKWFFWTNDVLKEVDYSDSKVVKVVRWDNKSNVIVKNK